MKSIILVLVSVALLSGCQLTRVEGEVDDMEVKVGTKENNDDNGKFCPPGQKKKGKC
ncbi:membrane lipoprotein lipid attachment site-containing protein [Pseudoalteromonas piscicida]|uniref:membrane lipoprotein lipid attachment site-containing protein n=1 Tax=Pseudoalteromonas piscicida TaxID=43662 RepID=UPI001554185F|nr:membrane lipoprotein lipid attachment site-containing protein [Pseudoalteromonas piscicida]